MPWTTTIGPQGAEVRFFGRTEGREVFEAKREALLQTYEQGLQYAVIDFSRIDYLDLLQADLLRIAEYDRQYLLRNASYLLAIIAPQASVSGLAKTFQRFMEGSTMRSVVVRTRDEALAWLQTELTETAA